jgi:Lipopolysaccharide kinase (Kdo/WaaP) family.
MKLVLNPSFESLRTFVEDIPALFEKEGHTIYKGRNEIKVFEVNGIQINVKRYKVPILINRFVYSFFRKTKASKAYFNALRLIEMGFVTPEPIAYIEEKSGGLLHISYFISIHSPQLKEIREYYWGPLQGNETLFAEFAHFTGALHDKGVYHLDYSPGNVLVGKENGHFVFSLVDINRMKFIPVGIKLGCRNFERMFDNDEVYSFIASEYAVSRGFDKSASIDLVLKFKSAFLKKNARKKRLKSALK